MNMTDLPLYYNAVDILEHNLAERADKTALYSRERNLTFREVSNEANQIGNALRKLGVRRGEYVALLSLDVPEWVTTFFGTLKIGAVHIGINTLLTPTEYKYIFEDSRPAVLVVHGALWPKVKEIWAELPFLKHVIIIGEGDGKALSYTDWIVGESAELETVSTHREDFCTLNYSSGTTGQPKGILHAHKD
ncbi:MAG: AMP-binding protein, partial [Anaerolineales bacterium]|nr:AMP-binding protein [Anaerolineales bacterium]